jgi:hypothetical protein
MKTALCYDLEIVKAVPGKDEPLEGIEYCFGWHDHASMGISTVCAYDYGTDRWRVFCADNFSEFMALANTCRPLVSFNGIGFDNRVLEAALMVHIEPDVCYDVLREMWVAAGLSPEYGTFDTHGGFGLDATAKVNLNQHKTGHGEVAPVEWQRGNIGRVIDYCTNDVRLTKRLFDRVRLTGGLRDPRNPSRFLEMRRPKTFD